MKKLCFAVLCLAASACNQVSAPDAKTAKDALAVATTACAFRESLPEKAAKACESLDNAVRVTRDAAKGVLEALPEDK